MKSDRQFDSLIPRQPDSNRAIVEIIYKRQDQILFSFSLPPDTPAPVAYNTCETTIATGGASQEFFLMPQMAAYFTPRGQNTPILSCYDHQHLLRSGQVYNIELGRA